MVPPLDKYLNYGMKKTYPPSFIDKWRSIFTRKNSSDNLYMFIESLWYDILILCILNLYREGWLQNVFFNGTPYGALSTLWDDICLSYLLNLYTEEWIYQTCF